MKEILKDDSIEEMVLVGSVTSDQAYSRTEPLTLVGNGSCIEFPDKSCQLKIVGHGPFRFRNIVFRHGEEMGVDLLIAEDSQVVFEECSFEGAWGGAEDQLATAIRLKGNTRAVFERCHFRLNDIHVVAENNSSCEFRQCSMQSARADSVRLNGQAKLTGCDLSISESGWGGIVAQGQASIELRETVVKQNGCDGLELSQGAYYRGNSNLFTENGYNGVVCSGQARMVSEEDQFLANGLCGLDVSCHSRVVLERSQSFHNESHGVQVRDESQLYCTDALLSENKGSGVALFGKACLTAEDLTTENNKLSGLQSSEDSRIRLCRGTVSQNGASGLSAFDRSRVNIDRSRLNDSGGHGLQVAGDCHVSLIDCELMENKRSGAIFTGATRAFVEGNTLAHNGCDGLVTADRSKATISDNLIRSNLRDGLLILSTAPTQLLFNQAQRNGRHGLYAATSSQPLLDGNQFSENEADQVKIETQLARQRAGAAQKESPAAAELPVGVTLHVEGSGQLHIPFKPKEIEKTLLTALAKHGRLSEAALGKVTRSRRVGGAMENLIDRLNRCGLPFIHNDGCGPEGNIYCLKVDTSRQRQIPGRVSQENQREISAS